MANKAWKQFERRVAEYFGCHRSIVNSGAAREDSDGSDTTHPALHIECKLLARNGLRSIWLKTKAAALKAKKDKLPVACVGTKNCPGFLIVIHSDDFIRVCDEFLTVTE